MATGNTTTDALADSLPTILFAARIVRENDGVMTQLVDRQTLDENKGLTWNELTYAQLTAQAITELTELDNPQQMSDTLLSITPTMIGIETVITDRVARRIDSKGYAKLGSLAQNAIERKKDEDGLTVLDSATTSLCGAGTTLASGYLRAAARRITSNATEPGKPPMYGVLNGYQIKDLEDELLASIGTYAVPEGMTADVYRNFFRGKVGTVEIFEDGNITIDSSDDAKGGVFAKEGVILVQGKAPWARPVRDESLGGGATKLYHYDEYAYGERSSGNWLYEIYSDAALPTS